MIGGYCWSRELLTFVMTLIAGAWASRTYVAVEPVAISGSQDWRWVERIEGVGSG